MRHTTLPALSLLLSSLLLSPPARATVMLKLELEHLVGRADVIFVGKVARLDSHWTEDGKQIVTDATFEVIRNVRGVEGSRPVVVRSMGGVVDGMGMRVFGSPQFQLGQQALLFTEVRQGHRYVSGMTQGVFPVSRDAQGRDQVRGSVAAGLTLTRRTPGGGLDVVREPAPAPELLSSFVTRIHQTIALCAREKARCQTR